MQTLWSRIAQTNLSCHCPSCVSVVARRTTTAAGRRPARWALSSTFVYSGIFAAAATTDAGIKQKRRDQWDRAIADIKHDLDEPAHAQPNQDEEEKVRFKPLFDDPQEVLLEDEGDTLGPNASVWPTNTGIPLKKSFLAPNSVYASQWAREKAMASRWSPKKLRTVEMSVDKLILRLLLHLDNLGLRDNLENAVPESCLDFFDAPSSQLKAFLLYTNEQHMETCSFRDSYADMDAFPRQHQYGVTYGQDTLGEYHHTAATLNQALSRLFSKRESGQLSHKDLVSKIAYNLYISPAAPSIDCWNTLLTGFLRDNKQDIAVIEPIILAIRNANVRLNETTLKAHLKYFIMIDSPTRFAKFVEKMHGLHGGLSLAKQGINITESGRPRLVRDEETGKVYQNPYPTPGVFEMLIQGVLRFVGFDAALRVCKDMGQQGWGLSIRGLTPLLDDRARNADYEAGCQVWDLIKMLQKESRNKRQPERLFAQTYSAMLRLCSACDEMTRFDEILREARAAKYQSRELLALFKEEMHPSLPPDLKPGVRNIRYYVKDVGPEDFDTIVPKGSRWSVPSESSTTPEPSDITPTRSQLDAKPNALDGDDRLDSTPTPRAKIVNPDDDWLDSAMAAGAKG